MAPWQKPQHQKRSRSQIQADLRGLWGMFFRFFFFFFLLQLFLVSFIFKLVTLTFIVWVIRNVREIKNANFNFLSTFVLFFSDIICYEIWVSVVWYHWQSKLDIMKRWKMVLFRQKSRINSSCNWLICVGI